MRKLIVGMAAAVLLAPFTVQGQARAFLVRLGNDTVAIERFEQRGNHIEGSILRHFPQTNILKYTIHLNDDGTVAWYQQSVTRADGSPPPNAPTTPLKITFTGDSVLREVVQQGQPVTLRAAAPKGTLAVIPNSQLYAEFVIRAAKAGAVNSIGVNPQQAAPSPLTVKLVGSDSAEIIAGGFRTGFKLNASGQVIRADGTLTTQKFIATPIASADIAAIATAWAAKDASGAAMGAMSTRDTVVATVGGANIWIDYGRPAKRGRKIWGALVPFDTTWRLGANSATQFRTDKDLEIGGVTVPAGTYTLFLFPTATQTYLIVNSQTGQWGTVYDSTKNVARIPVEAHMSLPAEEERFRIFVQGDQLMMHWDRGGYGVKLKAK
ncbi:MAG TPA: DUF2911 domain-containing protein [Gemmatimonadaceae bacterium]|nr:DUF2911 domain-containing protein [Gemmatimonadaceae bacterium]